MFHMEIGNAGVDVDSFEGGVASLTANTAAVCIRGLLDTVHVHASLIQMM